MAKTQTLSPKPYTLNPNPKPQAVEVNSKDRSGNFLPNTMAAQTQIASRPTKFRVGLGFRVQGSGFRVQGSGSRV